MSFQLDKVVPWGRSFDEYREMFALSEEDLKRNILDCGGGPSSFTCTLTKLGGRATSCDPLYEFSAHEIRASIDETFGEVIEQTRGNMDQFVWDRIKSIEELAETRMSEMNEFLEDYENGKGKRYVAAGLPALPFKDGEFDLAVCSHLLFLYGEQLSFDFHVSSIRELCRVSPEVRVFPLLELGGDRSRHLDKVIEELKKYGFGVEIEEVPYEFQKGGNEMVRILRETRL